MHGQCCSSTRGMGTVWCWLVRLGCFAGQGRERVGLQQTHTCALLPVMPCWPSTTAHAFLNPCFQQASGLSSSLLALARPFACNSPSQTHPSSTCESQSFMTPFPNPTHPHTSTPPHTHTQVSGKPIKFVGTGETMDALEPFYPERMASRVLGMGDVLTLYEKAEQVCVLPWAVGLWWALWPVACGCRGVNWCANQSAWPVACWGWATCSRRNGKARRGWNGCLAARFNSRGL